MHAHNQRKTYRRFSSSNTNLHVIKTVEAHLMHNLVALSLDSRIYPRALQKSVIVLSKSEKINLEPSIAIIFLYALIFHFGTRYFS